MEQTERIILDVDGRPAKVGSAEANRDIASVETTAEKAVDAANRALAADADRVVRVTQRSRNAINQIVSAAERKALGAGRSPVQQLEAERDRNLNRVAGEPEAVQKLTAAYERLISVAKRDEVAKAADRATAASQRAISKQREFEQALLRVNAQARRRQEEEAAARARASAALEKEIRLLEQRARTSNLTRVQALRSEKADFIGRVADPASITRVTSAYEQLIGVQSRADSVAMWQRSAAAATSFGTALTVGVTLPIGLTAIAALKVSEQFKSATRAFTQMLGGQEKASQFLSELERFASTTPFEFADLVPAAQRMKALGFAGNEVIPVLRAVGDQVAALGRGQEFIDRITLALGQMKTKGKVSFEEVRQLAEAGVPAFQAIAEKLGISIPEAMRRAEKGAISAAAAVPAILERMVRETGGLMAKQNLTVTGQFSNLKDQTGFLLRDIGNTLEPAAMQVIKFGQTVVGGLRSAAQGFILLPSSVQKATGALVGFVALAGPVTAAAGKVAQAMAFLGSINIGAGFTAFTAALMAIPGIITTVATAIATGMTGALIGGELVLLLFAKAALVVGVAFAAWKTGQWIADILGIGDAADTATVKLQAAAEADLKFATAKGADALKRRGVIIEQSGQTVQQWAQQVRGAQSQLRVFDEMAKAGNSTHAERGKILAAEKRAHAELVDAQHDGADAISRLLLNHVKLREELGLSTRANRELGEAVVIRLRREAENQLKSNAKRVLDGNKEARKFDEDRYRDSLRLEQEIAALGVKTTESRLSQEEAALDGSRDRQLRAVQLVNAKTLEQKIAVESRKAAIEEEYQVRSFATRASLLDQQMKHEVAIAEAGARLRGETEDQIARRRSLIIEEFGARGLDLELKTQAAIDAARENGVLRVTELRISAEEKIHQLSLDRAQDLYDSLKRGTVDFLNLVESRSGSTWSKLKDMAKAAFLSPLNEAFASYFAGMQTKFLTGINPVAARQQEQRAELGLGGLSLGSGGGGLLARLGLGGGGLGAFASGSPGGTPGFAGPVGGFSGGGGAAGGGGGAFGQFGTIGASQAASLKSLFGIGGSVSTGAGTATTFGAATFGQKLSAIGKSNAALAAGGLLAFDGLRRGGALGLAETTAGGALIGFRFGGPIGAAIGAGVGALAGTIRLFVKGAVEKIVAKTKAIYGITLDSKYARDPILGIIKSQYGGNIDVGLRSPQVRDLIELYGMSMGQGNGPLTDRLRPLTFSDRGRAGIVETPGYFNGRALTIGTGNSVSVDGGGSVPAQVVVQSLQLVVGAESAAAFMQGQIAESPVAVATALQTANRYSIGRRDNLAGQFGMVTS